MGEKITKTDGDRFLGGAEKYAAYLETPEGRLRLDLVFANLQDFLPQASRSLRALDLGCGTGAIAIRLAKLGIHVTLLDSSPQMLDLAKRAAVESGVKNQIELKREGVRLLQRSEYLRRDVREWAHGSSAGRSAASQSVLG